MFFNLKKFLSFSLIEYIVLIFPFTILSGPLLSDIFISFFFLTLAFKLLFVKDSDISIYFRKFLNNKYFIIFFIFFIYININSYINFNWNVYYQKSFHTSLPYLRFIFASYLIAFIFIENRIALKIFLFILVFIIVFLVFDGIYQYIFKVNLFGMQKWDPNRITSIFDDEQIVGSYIIKTLPLSLIFFFNNKKYLDKKNLFLITIFLAFQGILIFLSGERTSFALFIIFMFLFLIIFQPILKFFLIGFFPVILLLILIISFNPTAKKRMIIDTYNQIFIHGKIAVFSEIHQSHYVTAIKMFKDKPLIGHGVKSFRKVCKNYEINKWSCTTHPHNYYIQFLAELGILGFLFLLYFYLFILYKFIKTLKIKNQSKKIIKLLIYSSFLLNLFPFMPTGNFFNNFNSILLYLPVIFLIYYNFNKKIFR